VAVAAFFGLAYLTIWAIAAIAVASNERPLVRN
jgi:hypothetical protein